LKIILFEMFMELEKNQEQVSLINNTPTITESNENFVEESYAKKTMRYIIVALAFVTSMIGMVTLKFAITTEFKTLQTTSLDASEIPQISDPNAYFPYSYMDGQSLTGESKGNTWTLTFFDRATQDFCLNAGQCSSQNVGYMNGLEVNSNGKSRIKLSGGAYCPSIHSTREGYVYMTCGLTQTLTAREVTPCIYEFIVTGK